MKTITMIVVGMVLCGLVWGQDQKSASADIAIASGPVSPCMAQGSVSDPDGRRECEKRDTARLFLIAGKPDAALRVLCTTVAAEDSFREPDNRGKYEDNPAASLRCKQAVGVEVK
jgi:hypothetical protein